MYIGVGFLKSNIFGIAVGLLLRGSMVSVSANLCRMLRKDRFLFPDKSIRKKISDAQRDNKVHHPFVGRRLIGSTYS